jgi:hypothetical protein
VLTLGRLALPALLLAASVGVAAPASADVTGSTSTGDVVLYDHCQQHPISYDVLVDPGTSLWRLEIQVLDPQGHTSEGSVVNSATHPATSGTVEHTFCGSEPSGTYTVRATGFYEVLPAVQIPFALPDTTFTVRPVTSRTTLSRTASGPGHFRLSARVQQEAEHGWARANGAPVRLERLVHGTWRTVPGLTLTTVKGRAVARIAGRPGQRLRAVVPSRGTLVGSTSRAVTL